MSGSSARSQKTPEDQLAEFRVLDYLAEARDDCGKKACAPQPARPRPLLAGMVRKKWIAREDLSDARDAARTVKVAVLEKCGGQAQRQPEDADRHSGRCRREERRWIALQSLEVPRTTLSTLVKRGMVEIVEEAGGVHPLRTEGPASAV